MMLMAKKIIRNLFFLMLFFAHLWNAQSTDAPINLQPGHHIAQPGSQAHTSSTKYQLWCFADNPIELSLNHFPENAELMVFNGQIEILSRANQNLNAILSVPIDQYLQFSFQGEQLRTIEFNWKYKDPHRAFLDFTRMYSSYAQPWQRRFYLDYYISPISANQRKYDNTHYMVSYPVTLGAPYSWGGKQYLQHIHHKILKNGSVNHWMEYYAQKSSMHPVNLDADESIWDYRPGPENPQYWTGVDCSGLLEVCCSMAGLIYSWRNAELIASGDYRSCSNFKNIRPGDIFVLKRDGIVVHFGAISRKGPTIATTWIIHSAWFTSFRYNTNALLKVAETSLSEFRSFYTWEIRRYHVR
jgi:hypothetical protein